MFRQRNFYLMLVLDAVLVTASFYLAFLIRFEFGLPRSQTLLFWKILPWLLAVKMALFWFFNLYRGMWRYTSLVDLINVAKASLSGSLLIVAVILMTHRFIGYPRSVF
ncbi:MAG: polysaccharide biosynthesis protein, partial [Thermodesulfobacteriota bacterium]